MELVEGSSKAAELAWAVQQRDERMCTVGPFLVGVMLLRPFRYAVQHRCNAFCLAVLIQAPHDVEQMLFLVGGGHARSWGGGRRP